MNKGKQAELKYQMFHAADETKLEALPMTTVADASEATASDTMPCVTLVPPAKEEREETSWDGRQAIRVPCDM